LTQRGERERSNPQRTKGQGPTPEQRKGRGQNAVGGHNRFGEQPKWPESNMKGLLLSGEKGLRANGGRAGRRGVYQKAHLTEKPRGEKVIWIQHKGTKKVTKNIVEKKAISF